ncbi:MAG: helix-turn-helix domain-containing protein [Kiritimatiellia bacterium]
MVRDLRKRAGLTLDEIQSRSGVTPAVLSRIERNLAQPELDTLYRLARVFGMTATDLLSLAEQRSSHTTEEEHYTRRGFDFRKVTYGNLTVFHATAQAGVHVSTPEVHHNEYELFWVLKGAVRLVLPNEQHVLRDGQAIQFDAALEHAYEVVDDSEMVMTHIRKGMRY